MIRDIKGGNNFGATTYIDSKRGVTLFVDMKMEIGTALFLLHTLSINPAPSQGVAGYRRQCVATSFVLDFELNFRYQDTVGMLRKIIHFKI